MQVLRKVPTYPDETSLPVTSVMAVTNKFKSVSYHTYLVLIVQTHKVRFCPRKAEASEVKFLMVLHQQPLQ